MHDLDKHQNVVRNLRQCHCPDRRHIGVHITLQNKGGLLVGYYLVCHRLSLLASYEKADTLGFLNGLRDMQLVLI